MTFDYRAWHRQYMKKKRTPAQEAARVRRLLSLGRCPVCEMLLSSRHHRDCPYLSTLSPGLSTGEVAQNPVQDGHTIDNEGIINATSDA